MKNFINRPIPRLLRYELLLKGVMEETPPNHEDRLEIPQVLEVIKALGKDTEPGVTSAKQKVELWKYNSNLVFKPGEYTVRPRPKISMISPFANVKIGYGSFGRKPVAYLFWEAFEATRRRT